jgi:hypothetical protein
MPGGSAFNFEKEKPGKVGNVLFAGSLPDIEKWTKFRLFISIKRYFLCVNCTNCQMLVDKMILMRYYI